MKVLSLFSGIGAYEKALSNLNVNFDLVNYCEIDKQTSKCYSAIHNIDESKNLKDVKNINPISLPDIDLLVYSPPCQDISRSGTHMGISEHSRTGLMWNVIDIIKEKNPKYFIMENVRTLGSVYKSIFEDYIKTISDLGYNCHNDILNSKDYGTPQNRHRLFLIGIRKDIEQKFQTPTKQKLIKQLKDYLNDLNIQTIDKEVSFTIRCTGRKSRVGNKHNWDGYLINGKEYYLTAKDCLKLMGFDDNDYNKMKNSNIPEKTIYKVAGNSVVVSVLEAIFKNLLLI